MSHDNTGKNEKGALRGDQNQLMFGQGFSFSGYERDPLYINSEGKKFTDISGVSGIDSITDGRAGVFAGRMERGNEEAVWRGGSGTGLEAHPVYDGGAYRAFAKGGAGWKRNRFSERLH